MAATTKEVARPSAATSFVVSFVMALNRVNIVAVNAILVLHVGKTGRRTVGRTPLGLNVPSPLGLHVWRNQGREVWGAKPPGIARGLGVAAPQNGKGVWVDARPPNSKIKSYRGTPI